MSNWAIWTALASALVNCLVTAVNGALRSHSRAVLGELFDSVDRGGDVERFYRELPRYLLATSSARVMLNLLMVGSILYHIQSRGHWSHSPLMQYGVALLIASAVVLVLGVAVPHHWATHGGERLIFWNEPMMRGLSLLLRPIIALQELIDPVMERLIGGDTHPQDHEEKLTDEVLSAVEQHDEAGTVDDMQKDMIEAVIELPSTQVGQVMTPRTDIQGVELSTPLEEVKRAILEGGHSRIPVYRESLDQIVGILYAKDLIRFLGRDAPIELEKQVRPAMMVPQTKPVRELLAEFRDKKVHLAIVLDEYGGTAGLITIEDIIEEIVGEIADEYEPLNRRSPEIEPVGENRYDIDARMSIDDVNDQLEVELPESDDYETLAGFLMTELGRIPAVGETLERPGLRLTVTEAEPNRVKTVRLERLNDEADPAASARSA